MLTTDEAFRKFKSRLELNDKEQVNASARHKEIREHVRGCFKLDDDFLTGSYARYTKTKPLKDVDILCVLDKDNTYRKKHPNEVLSAFEKCLAENFGSAGVSSQRRSVCVDFGVKPDADDKTDYRIISVDVVPAVSTSDHYEIPDKTIGDWIKTNPKTHAKKAVDAHEAYAKEWKGIVRMMKYWNNHHDRPIKPSFLIEVMALECLHPPFGGRFDYEFQGLFATFADRIYDTWDDPAGLGPPVSDMMDDQRKASAKAALNSARREVDLAINLARQGKQGDSLRAWRTLFGPRFPLS